MPIQEWGVINKQNVLENIFTEIYRKNKTKRDGETRKYSHEKG